MAVSREDARKILKDWMKEFTNKSGRSHNLHESFMAAFLFRTGYSSQEIKDLMRMTIEELQIAIDNHCTMEAKIIPSQGEQ